MKTIENCAVISQEEISPGIFSLRLQTEKIAGEACAGQFVNVYCNDRSRILPRPISICDADSAEGILRLVYRVTGPGTGTEEFSMLSVPESTGKGAPSLRIEGPLGNGFDTEIPPGERVMIVGGGIGIPPMLMTAKRIRGEKMMVLGYRDSLFLSEEFEKYGPVHIATEDGSAGIKGNVLDAIREKNLTADRIYACGPKPMLRALSQWADKQGIPCWVSMEERMACGIGACLACVCRSKEVDSHTNVKNRRVCKDGPVFLSTEVEI